MVYWWVGNWAKNWYRESQIFEVRQAHPRTIFVKVTPPPGLAIWAMTFVNSCKFWHIQCMYPYPSQLNYPTYWFRQSSKCTGAYLYISVWIICILLLSFSLICPISTSTQQINKDKGQAKGAEVKRGHMKAKGCHVNHVSKSILKYLGVLEHSVLLDDTHINVLELD